MVPVAVRPASLQPTNKASQKALPVPPPGPLGLRGSIDLLCPSCGTRLPCSLVDAVCCPLLCCDDTNNTPQILARAIIPSCPLPTSPFSSAVTVSVTVIVTATARCCARCLPSPVSLVPQVPALPRLQRWTVIFLRSSRRTWMSLALPTLISTVRLPAACPPPLSSQPTSVYQTRARLKKEHKRVGRAHSPVDQHVDSLYLSPCLRARRVLGWC